MLIAHICHIGKTTGDFVQFGKIVNFIRRVVAYSNQYKVTEASSYLCGAHRLDERKISE